VVDPELNLEGHNSGVGATTNTLGEIMLVEKLVVSCGRKFVQYRVTFFYIRKAPIISLTNSHSTL
jgi:hypothetical protein